MKNTALVLFKASLAILVAAGAVAYARDLIKGDLDQPVRGGHAKFPSRVGDTPKPDDGLPHPMLCYNSTPNEISKELAVDLCAGAYSAAPADCYRATPTDLSPELSVRLCKYAESTAPAECYMNSPTELSKDLAVTLCAYR